MQERPTIDRDGMRQRTKSFALRIMRMVDALPRKRSADVIGRQLLRSATSVSANYRAALRARSRKEFIAKLGVVEEEADECSHWIELLIEGDVIKEVKAADLLAEASELTAIVVASIRTARRRSSKSEIRNPKSEINRPRVPIQEHPLNV